MPKQELDETTMRDAINGVVDAHDVVRRRRLFERILNSLFHKNTPLADVVDVVISLDDPIRAQRKLDIQSYLQEHPGTWDEKKEQALRQAIESDRSLHRFW